MDWSPCKKCGSQNILLVEHGLNHPEFYDGISEIECKSCGARIGRWSGSELAPGEAGPRFGSI